MDCNQVNVLSLGELAMAQSSDSPVHKHLTVSVRVSEPSSSLTLLSKVVSPTLFASIPVSTGSGSAPTKVMPKHARFLSNSRSTLLSSSSMARPLHPTLNHLSNSHTQIRPMQNKQRASEEVFLAVSISFLSSPSSSACSASVSICHRLSVKNEVPV